MRYETVTLTPEDARAILERTAHRQRALSETRVTAFASAMERGQWLVTHQAIALDEAGMLIDGQHRIAAIVKSGIPVPVTIAYGVDQDTFDVIDTGAARSAAATLQIAGHTDTNIIAAAARMILTYDRIKGTTTLPAHGARAMISSHDILAFAESDRGAILRGQLASARRTADTLGRLGIRTWLSAALTLLYESGADVQLRTEWTEKLENGTMLREGSPILSLRRWLVSDTGYQRVEKVYRSYVGIAVFGKAWNAWIEGRELRVVAFRFGIERMPILLASQPTADDIEETG